MPVAGIEGLEGIDRSGADALIPVDEAREIIKHIPARSAAMTLMRTIPMSTKVRTQPILAALPSAYWVNGDVGLKRTTGAAWDGLSMTAEEIAAIVVIPEAVLDDTDYDVWGEIRPLIAEAIGDRVDETTLFGIDKPPSFPDAILIGAAAAGQTVQPGSIADEHGNHGIALDIGGEGGVMNLVEESGYAVNGFAAKTRIKARLRGQRDTVGAPIYQASTQDGNPAQLYEEPIIYPDANGAWEGTDVDLIGGDWSKAMLGIRQDITYKLLDQAVLTDNEGNILINLPQQDSVALRVTCRLGFQVANPINRKRQDEEERYPFAALVSPGS